MHPDWVRSIRDQCVEAGVPFFLKQHGEWVPSDMVPSSHAHYNDVKSRSSGPCIGRCVNLDGTLMVRVGKKAAGRILDGREWNEWPGVEK